MNRFQKLLAVVIVALLGCGAASAQFRFGIKAGLNVDKMSISGSELISADNSCGFTGGVMTEFEVPIIGICLDASLMYTRMNTSIDVAGLNVGNVDNKIGNKIGKNFIEIPVNLKYKLNLPAVAAIIKPYVFTGPSFAFKLDKETAKTFDTKTCQVAWNLGLGVELIKHLQIGASYGWNINNAAKMVLPLNTAEIKAKNNYWTVTAAWLF